MRIVDLTTLYLDGGEGGVNTYLIEKARYLEKNLPEIEHTLVVPGQQTVKDRLGASTVYKLASPGLPGNPRHRVLVDFSRIAALLRELEPDVVEVDCSYFLGHLAARALGHRRVPIVGL